MAKTYIVTYLDLVAGKDVSSVFRTKDAKDKFLDRLGVAKAVSNIRVAIKPEHEPVKYELPDEPAPGQRVKDRVGVIWERRVEPGMSFSWRPVHDEMAVMETWPNLLGEWGPLTEVVKDEELIDEIVEIINRNSASIERKAKDIIEKVRGSDS